MNIFISSRKLNQLKWWFVLLIFIAGIVWGGIRLFHVMGLGDQARARDTIITIDAVEAYAVAELIKRERPQASKVVVFGYGAEKWNGRFLDYLKKFLPDKLVECHNLVTDIANRRSHQETFQYCVEGYENSLVTVICNDYPPEPGEIFQNEKALLILKTTQKLPRDYFAEVPCIMAHVRVKENFVPENMPDKYETAVETALDVSVFRPEEEDD